MTDIFLSFPLGTFFIIDIISYYLWRKLVRFTHYSNHAIFLYCIRYFGLYMIGMAVTYVISQILYCMFFGVVFRIVRGSRRTALLYRC